VIKLYVIDGTEEGQSFDIGRDAVFVGRSSENEIQMRDKAVSRRHLKIQRRGQRFLITDLDSRNGTYVNGERIASGIEHDVAEGEAITVGMSVVCIGKGCLEHVMPFMESIYPRRMSLQGPEDASRDRPLTAKRNMELFYKVSNVLTQSDSIHQTLKEILSYILDHLQRIDRGSLILVDSETGRYKEEVSILKGDRAGSLKAYSRTVVERVMRDRKAIKVSDTYSAAENEISESMKIMRVRSVMCVPLISRAQIQGVIYIDSVERPHGFRDEDLALLTALSSPTAIAIENARFSPDPSKIRLN
jgi:pSer/pThr/pTyr-binding forkhead associated (FHA) protein